MISIVKLILEEKGKFDYGCVMLYFDFPELKDMQKQIDPEDLYKPEKEDTRSYGVETEPHCTLLYGLHDDVTLDQVKGTLQDFTFTPLKLHNISTFDNPKYDVLKFDVKGPNLKEANKALKEFPFTSDFPDYHAHSTIAYLNKGEGKKYIGMFKGKEYTATPSYAVYSMPNGTKHKIKIKVS